MALIKCSECGCDVSNKAEVCPNCGCPVSVSLEQEKVQKAKIKEKQKKKLIKCLCFFLVLVIIGFSFGAGLKYVVTKPERDGYYNKAKWGMSVEDIKQIASEDVVYNEDKNTLIDDIKDYDQMEKVSAGHIYKFDEDGLCEVTIFIVTEEDCEYSTNELIEKYSEKFNSLYGESKKEDVQSTWNSPKSEIKIINFSDEMIVIKYCDIEKTEDNA